MQELEERFGDESVASCLDHSSDSDLESYAEPYARRVRLEDCSAIRALYYDLQVRYQETDEDLFNHLYEFLKEDTTKTRKQVSTEEMMRRYNRV